MSRLCTKCKDPKSDEDFYRDKRPGRGDFKSWCKDCHQANGRARELFLNYGLTIEEFEKRWDEQKGLCAICDIPFVRKPRGHWCLAQVDHDHKTGQIRQLLCKHCNLLLGHARDSINNLRSAIRYLETHQTSKHKTTE